MESINVLVDNEIVETTKLELANLEKNGQVATPQNLPLYMT